MRVNPYYSINHEPPHVHHTRSNCPSGMQIPSENRRSGTNGDPECGTCRNM